MFFSKLNLKLSKKSKWVYNRSVNKLRAQIADPEKREHLNNTYNNAGHKTRSLVHRLYAKIFRDVSYDASDGEWTVYFMNKPVRLPLRKDNIWLDWDIAVSVIGHDTEIKLTYENLIRSGKVRVFFDIGANYGTHSILFMTQSVKTIAFEPNGLLKKEFDLYSQLNKLDGKMEMLALGDKAGTVKLSFQAHDTWNGSIVDTTVDTFKGESVETIDVPMMTLDHYVAENKIQPDLLKIDTEGNEIHVLEGAVQTIESARPFILFETNKIAERPSLWNYFSDRKYKIHGLPYAPGNKDRLLTEDQFLKNGSNNFIATPE